MASLSLNVTPTLTIILPPTLTLTLTTFLCLPPRLILRMLPPPHSNAS